MKEKFLEFMQRWYRKEGDCCPKFLWDEFVINEFESSARQLAVELTNKLIEAKCIRLVNKSVGVCYEISQCGIEMIKNENWRLS